MSTGWSAGPAADGFADESSGPPGAIDGFPGSAVGDGVAGSPADLFAGVAAPGSPADLFAGVEAAGAGVVLSGGVSGRETGNRTRCELPGATSPGFRMVGGRDEPLSSSPSPRAISRVVSGLSPSR